jgi:putative flippase GtrA
MGLGSELATLGLYGLVGALSAGLHGLVLLLLPRLGMTLPLANLTGFLVASLWSYLAHAKVTFRRHTQGRVFPRRWLLVQLGLNVALSLLLPLLLAAWAQTLPVILLLVFTPTAVNYGVWSLAARHVAAMQSASGPAPIRHADDLGLHPAINQAIFVLADQGQLQSASLMVAGPAVGDALAGIRLRPQLRICLHLVLTEGPPSAPKDQIPLLLDRQGLLNLGFGQLLWASLCPSKGSRRLAQQLGLELQAQISRFVAQTGCQSIHLDGHQHVHLVPIVWRQLLQLDPALRPVWLRTIREPWPTGVPVSAWGQSLVSAGWIKWLLLSLLSWHLRPILLRSGLATNAWFSGVLFTGHMAGATLIAAERQLRVWDHRSDDQDEHLTAPMLLGHPALLVHNHGGIALDCRYRHSTSFYTSDWRQREFDSLSSLGLHALGEDASYQPGLVYSSGDD